MKICKRILNFVQIIDYKGTVRLCGWLGDCVIGSLSSSSLKEIYHGEKADYLRKKIAAEDYSNCNIDGCPFLSMNDMENHIVEIDELPEYPTELYLAYEEVCNYACTSCTTPDVMKHNFQKREELEEGYAKIEKGLEDVLPHIKTISANGRGELFACKHILNILANWKPLAPKEEVSVILETNGSLFDEKHWKQISNLGQYHLSVLITVMSFEEKIYQTLSGTKLPISQIENNLRFVKGLREQGIVNYFEIATVVQERNFRTMPEFARRCVEEFGADYVRLRPYNPWGAKEPEVEWFTDPRNPLHPYNTEYLEVMSSPIFKHPKVHDWGGGRPSVNTGDFPNRMEKRKYNIMKRLLMDEHWAEQVKEKIGNKHIVIYGMAEIGRSIVNEWSDKLPVLYLIDKKNYGNKYKGKMIYSLEQAKELEKDVTIIITPLTHVCEIKTVLENIGYKNGIYSIEELENM